MNIIEPMIHESPISNKRISIIVRRAFIFGSKAFVSQSCAITIDIRCVTSAPVDGIRLVVRCNSLFASSLLPMVYQYSIVATSDKETNTTTECPSQPVENSPSQSVVASVRFIAAVYSNTAGSQQSQVAIREGPHRPATSPKSTSRK